MKLNKETVASRQLDTAIKMFFEGGDTVSVHTLACAATNVFADLVRKLGRDPWSDHMAANYPGLEHEVRRTMRRAQNFFKHADKDHDQELDFDSTSNDEMIITGTLEYAEFLEGLGGTKKVTIPMGIFQMWYFAIRPELLGDRGKDILRAAAKLFPNLRRFPRFHQLAVGAELLRDPPLSRDHSISPPVKRE